jgi:hypothetical protein
VLLVYDPELSTFIVCYLLYSELMRVLIFYTPDWVPTHVLIINVLLLFTVLNPLVLPFGCVYFFVENGVVKNQVCASLIR